MGSNRDAPIVVNGRFWSAGAVLVGRWSARCGQTRDGLVQKQLSVDGGSGDVRAGDELIPSTSTAPCPGGSVRRLVRGWRVTPGARREPRRPGRAGRGRSL